MRESPILKSFLRPTPVLKSNSVIFIILQALLAGSDQIKFGYVSRAQVRDNSRHVILGTQQFKPHEFAAQINLSMDNAWGILRCIIDICMKQKDGKYFIITLYVQGFSPVSLVSRNNNLWSTQLFRVNRTRDTLHSTRLPSQCAFQLYYWAIKLKIQ